MIMAALVVDGVLTISGTPRNDVITLKQDSRGVYVEGSKRRFVPGRQIRSITILGGRGNDVIDAGNMKLPVLVDAGDGNDVVIGGSAADNLLGGVGDDRMEGRDGHDLLDGGLGRDRLAGGRGNDTFYASVGTDRDLVFGGAGRDYCDSRLASAKSVERRGAKGAVNALTVVPTQYGLKLTAINFAEGGQAVTVNTGDAVFTRTASSDWTRIDHGGALQATEQRATQQVIGALTAQTPMSSWSTAGLAFSAPVDVSRRAAESYMFSSGLAMPGSTYGAGSLSTLDSSWSAGKYVGAGLSGASLTALTGLYGHGAIPEPAGLAVLAVAGVGLLGRRQRRL